MTSDLVAVWFLPPLLMLVVLLVGVAILRWRPRTGLALVALGIALLWFTSAPIIANASLRAIEGRAPGAPLTGTGAGAIVVLGGGSYVNAPEYGTDTVGPGTLPRLRYAARLARQTALPILVVGGAAGGARSSEAEQMRDVLQQDLQSQANWIEPTATSTLQSALNSEKLLREEGIKKILLVTDAWHMRRARMAFERAGLDVVPAPISFSTRVEDGVVWQLLPSASAMQATRLAWREGLAIAWYRLKFLFS